MIPVPHDLQERGKWVASLNQTYGQLPAEEILALVLDHFGPELAFANSFGLEDVVLQHLLLARGEQPFTFVLDTGRLPNETYDLIERWRVRHDLTFHLLSPDAGELEAFVRANGPNAFYQSPDLRKRCCHIRKVEPLERALHGRPAWITGLRREQSQVRAQVEVFALDAQGRLKVSPLTHWTLAQVWDYIRTYKVPYNVLHDRGYPSLGCAPCTRAVAPDEDPRAGRWWWELDAARECGLHIKSKEETAHAT
jgi:phosphoadenosine phosphosulfate reductase